MSDILSVNYEEWYIHASCVVHFKSLLTVGQSIIVYIRNTCTTFPFQSALTRFSSKCVDLVQ